MKKIPTRPIVIANKETGQHFEFYPPDELWLDMIAFCQVTGITLDDLIRKSLDHFFRQMKDRATNG